MDGPRDGAFYRLHHGICAHRLALHRHSIGVTGPDFSGIARVGRTADVRDVLILILPHRRRLFPRAALPAEPHLLARHSRWQ